MTETPIGQPERKNRRKEGNLTTTIRLSELQIGIMGSIAKVEGVTQSELIRNALDDYFKKKITEYENAEGERRDLANRVNEVTIYSRELERAMNNLVPKKPPGN